MARYSLDEPDRRLELSEGEFRSCAEVAAGMIATLIGRIDRGELATVSAIDAPALAAFAASFGDEPGPPLVELAAELFEALGTGINSNTGGYMADIPGGGMTLGAIASLLTTAFNRWPGLYPGAPGLIEIEKSLLSWMCALAGLPAGSGGIFTSGGSMANFNAVFAARMNKLPDRLDRGTIYFSQEAHHSVPKAARMCGIEPDRMRAIATDAEFRIDPDRLLAAIEDDLAARLRPFLIVASAGTTATGAMDDLAALSRIARRHGCWLHVDAAWAGSLLLTERGRVLMHGIDRVDSITIDPHKAFWTPWGAGALLVADLRHLHRAFSFDAGYMPFDDAEDLSLNPSLISSELSRCARGLPLWARAQGLRHRGVPEWRGGEARPGGVGVCGIEKIPKS